MLSDRDVRSVVGDPREAIRRAGGEGFLDQVRVVNVMTREPTTVPSSASILEIAELLLDERIGAVPVVLDDDTLIGIISYVDVIGHFVGRGR
jgi:CBS domain-containing protein